MLISDLHPVPTCTANEHRLRIFQPTRRPILINETLKTSWGITHVAGRLGQDHADVMDAVLYVAEGKGETGDGRIKLLVDPYQLRKTSGIGSGEQLQICLRELMQTVITIIEPKELACMGHLLDHIEPAKRASGTPITKHNPLGGERAMLRVELGKALCKLLDADVWRRYDPRPISLLKHGISQAVARHFVSHNIHPQGGWDIDTLILAVAGDISGESMRNRRRELRADSLHLATLGLLVAGTKIMPV